jgi:hypothetical protein
MDDIEREYRIERSTPYGDDVAIVKVDKHARKQTIELYDGEPFEFKFLFIPIEREPIDIITVGPYTDIEKTLTKMIINYELPYYQEERLKRNDHYLAIDYEQEMKKRQPKEVPEVSTQHELQIYDYEEDKRYVITPQDK